MFSVSRAGSEEPGARGARVGHRFERGEGLRGNEEERLVGFEALDGFGEVGAVDVGDEEEVEVALRVMLQRFVRHDGTEIGAADADVDDVLDALSGVAFPIARANLVGEAAHLVEHLMDFGNDVFAVEDDGLGLGCAQGDVKDGAILGDVDLLAGEHRFGLRLEA
jgi:hypothetical protein